MPHKKGSERKARRDRRLMNGRLQFGSWMLDNWARMTLPLAVLLLCSLPIFLTADNMSLILLYTMLPVYMIHQYEEHAHGRFVAFVNSVVGKGYEVLTKVSAFWINILDVWLVFLVSFYLAKYVAIGFALVPIYLTVLNAVTHVIAGVVLTAPFIVAAPECSSHSERRTPTHRGCSRLPKRNPSPRRGAPWCGLR